MEIGRHGEKGNESGRLVQPSEYYPANALPHVAPDGTLRKDGLKMVEGGQTRNRHGKKH